MSSLDKLKQLVLDWGKEKGILKNSTPDKQALKMVEEVGEVAAGLCRGDNPKIADAIGDVAVTLILLADLCGMDFTACLDGAYQEISGRRGEMKGGIFIKDEDTPLLDKIGIEAETCGGCDKIGTTLCKQPNTCPTNSAPDCFFARELDY